MICEIMTKMRLLLLLAIVVAIVFVCGVLVDRFSLLGVRRFLRNYPHQILKHQGDTRVICRSTRVGL
jgi:hypothetical protein